MSGLCLGQCREADIDSDGGVVSCLASTYWDVAELVVVVRRVLRCKVVLRCKAGAVVCSGGESSRKEMKMVGRGWARIRFGKRTFNRDRPAIYCNDGPNWEECIYCNLVHCRVPRAKLTAEISLPGLTFPSPHTPRHLPATHPPANGQILRPSRPVTHAFEQHQRIITSKSSQF